MFIVMKKRLCIDLQWEDRLVFFPQGEIMSYPKLFVPNGIDILLYKRAFVEDLSEQQHRKK